MTPYLSAFCISLSICLIIKDWNRNGVGFRFWALIAMIVPCILAGVRADTVGTDVSGTGYAEPLFDLAHSVNSFAKYYGLRWQRWSFATGQEGPADFEIGYVVLVWVSSRLFDSVQGLLFMTQLLTIGPIYVTLIRLRNRGALPLGMCVYLFLYFNQSLNLMRQWIAVAFVLMGVIGFYRSDEGLVGYIKGLIPALFGVLFHSSALLGLVALAVRIYMDAGKKSLQRKVTMVSVLAAVAVIAINPLRSFLELLGFGRYVSLYLGSGAISFMPNRLILRLPMFALALVSFVRSGKSDSLNASLLCMSVFSIILSQLSSLSTYGGRVGVYFDAFSIVTTTTTISTFKSHDFRKALTVIIVLLYCGVYWSFNYVVSGYGETIPYRFFWE